MSRSRSQSRDGSWLTTLAASMAGVFAGPASAQYATNYTYVKMSLTVPWTLYFVFLAGILIPFIVMVVLAWRSAADPKPDTKSAVIDEPAQGEP